MCGEKKDPVSLGGLSLPMSLNKVQWKNPRAKPNEMYRPTTVEHVANIATHGVRDKLCLSNFSECFSA